MTTARMVHTPPTNCQVAAESRRARVSLSSRGSSDGSHLSGESDQSGGTVGARRPSGPAADLGKKGLEFPDLLRQVVPEVPLLAGVFVKVIELAR